MLRCRCSNPDRLRDRPACMVDRSPLSQRHRPTQHLWEPTGGIPPESEARPSTVSSLTRLHLPSLKTKLLCSPLCPPKYTTHAYTHFAFNPRDTMRKRGLCRLTVSRQFLDRQFLDWVRNRVRVRVRVAVQELSCDRCPHWGMWGNVTYTAIASNYT